MPLKPYIPASPRILDFCIAPGGFLHKALDLNPTSNALAFSLPIKSGGHKVLLPPRPNVATKFLDITMLAADMGTSSIPPDHPDAANFLPRELDEGALIDLVICDGQVLRTHQRASDREKRELQRLMTTQLALGLEHCRPGWTMIVRPHHLEEWDTVCILHTFSLISFVQLFKPMTAHRKRSSFYLVATNVQAERAEAVAAVQSWKAVWKTATFGTDEEYEAACHEGEKAVHEVLEQFGPELVRLGRLVWDIQAKALTKAPWMQAKAPAEASWTNQARPPPAKTKTSWKDGPWR